MKLFEPVRVGTLELRNRIMVPTHGAGVGRILGSDREAERFIAYYARQAAGGAAWIGGSATFLQTPLIPGWEPSGIGAVVRGSFRHPLFVERHARYAEALHAEGAVATVQMIIQGGLPHGASPHVSGFVAQDVPHPLSTGEIDTIVAEYGWSAKRAFEAGLDGIELHANHDDLLQFFLSPLSNRRTDEYGTDRLRLLLEALRSVRAAVGDDLTLGARLCLDEQLEGGYGFEDAVAMARRLDGLVDYLHVDVGNNWGAPSYLQPMQYDPADWLRMAATLREAVTVPVAYTGRVTDAEQAARIVADGAADIVGMTRAVIADPDLPRKALARVPARPCVGGNDCLHRTIVDGVRFSCAVNPASGHEQVVIEPAATPRRILVVGGGPAGMEVAALAAERGHDVTLWERESALGGQLAIAALAPHQHRFADYLAYQAARLTRPELRAATPVLAVPDISPAAPTLARPDNTPATPTLARPDNTPATPTLAKPDNKPAAPPLARPDNAAATPILARPGNIAATPVLVELARDATADDVLAFGADVVVLATGARARAPDVPGVEHAVQLRDVLAGAPTGPRVLLAVGEDHAAPLLGAAALVARGVALTIAYPGPQLAPHVGRYSIGGYVEPLFRAGAHFVPMQRLVSVAPAVTADVYAGTRTEHDVDTVVLAYGGTPRTELFAALEERVEALHLVGDAWAPRRLTVATRQAWELGRRL